MSGKTFLESLREKYTAIQEPVCAIFISANAPVVTDDGELTVPHELSLYQGGVCSAGDVNEVSKQCNHVTSLDLTSNLLIEWSEIISLLKCMPKVHFLNLSSNRLKCPLVADENTTFPSVTKLVLNSMGISWETVARLLDMMPRVEELHLCYNEYTTVDLEPDKEFPKVTRVLLNHNKMAAFSEVLKLSSAFPHLQHLIMMDNPITDLPDPDILKVNFSHLKYINIKKTKLTNWEQLEKFRYLPVLSQMKLQELPFLADLDEKWRRQMTIAYLPNLKEINGSVVGDDERVDAERAFIRHFMDRDQQPQRFTELEAVYGILDPLAEVTMKPENERTVRVSFEDKTKLCKINIKKTVRELKKELAKEMTEDIPPSQLKIFLTTNLGAPWTVELIHPNKFLYSLKIDDGDDFVLERRRRKT